MANTAQIFLLSLVSWVLATVAEEDICDYKKSYRDPGPSFKTCQWGCCYKYADPCCEPPVALIVGCTIGGFFCLMLIIIAICCCYCCCCRREPVAQQHMSARARRGHMVARYPNPHHPHGGDVQFSPGVVAPTGGPIPAPGQHDPTIPTVPPGVPLSPPSYEEVMAGETNPAYKPDNSIPPL